MHQARGESEAPAETEIGRLRREIALCRAQEQRLVKLYQIEEVDDDLVRA